MTIRFRFGTVGSPISTPKKPGGSVGAVLRLRELELDAFELGWVRSVRVSEETCAAIQTAGREQDVGLSVHAPYYINLNADEAEWPKSRQRLMDAAHYGNLAGATDIIFHPGSYFGKQPAEVLPGPARVARVVGAVKATDRRQRPGVIEGPLRRGRQRQRGGHDEERQGDPERQLGLEQRTQGGHGPTNA